MKIYRVSCRNVKDSHQGYSFHSSKADAEKAAREFTANGIPPEDSSTDITVIEVEPTKAGILAALNHYASHNDNG